MVENLTAETFRKKVFDYKEGKEWTEKQFRDRYDNLKQIKQYRPKEKAAINSKFQKISKLGIAALPLIIRKIEEGEIDFIPLVSQLTDNQLKKDSTRTECLIWWENNKQKWLIRFK